MLGKIESFRRDIGVGIIAAEDGHKYRFQRSGLVNGRDRLTGEEVDFLLSGRTPREIIVLAGSPWNVFGGMPARPFSTPAQPAAQDEAYAASFRWAA